MLGVNARFKCTRCGQKYVIWIPIDRLEKQGVCDKRQADELRRLLPEETTIKGLFTTKEDSQERCKDTEFIFADGTVRESVQCEKCKNVLDVDIVLQAMVTAGKIIRKGWTK